MESADFAKTARRCYACDSAETYIAPEGQVMIRGTGFEPNENVAVVVGNAVTETTSPAVAADTMGEFLAAVTVPALTSGQYQLVARGEAGSAAAESLTVM